MNRIRNIAVVLVLGMIGLAVILGCGSYHWPSTLTARACLGLEVAVLVTCIIVSIPNPIHRLGVYLMRCHQAAEPLTKTLIDFVGLTFFLMADVLMLVPLFPSMDQRSEWAISASMMLMLLFIVGAIFWVIRVIEILSYKPGQTPE